MLLFDIFLKFRYSEKALRFEENLPMILKSLSNVKKLGVFKKKLWPSQNT